MLHITVTATTANSNEPEVLEDTYHVTLTNRDPEPFNNLCDSLAAGLVFRFLKSPEAYAFTYDAEET